jgi:hypothetical protein
MKKFLTTIQGWWLLKFRNTIVQEVEFDAYKVTFRRFTMDITTKSGNMKLRTLHCEHPNAFLFSCLENGIESIIEKYCRRLYEFINFYTLDAGFADEYTKAINKFYKRMDKKAESIAKEITLDEDKLNEEVVKANIEVAKMTKAERKAHKEAIREVLTNEEE